MTPTKERQEMAALSKDAAFWSKISRKYAAEPIRDMDGYLRTLERTKSYLKASDTVLELGCGTGATALLLAPHVKHITGTDIAPGMIEIAKERCAEDGAENVTFRVAEALEGNADSTGYDVVMAHNLLHLLPDLGEALDRIASLTNPGGHFISKTVCAPARGGVKYALIRRLAIPVMQAVGKAPFVNFMPVGALERSVEDAGFQIIETADQEGMLPSRYIVAQKT
jgi:ubiquinone/menaquinone biosynthesis C-methylase UbiE